MDYLSKPFDPWVLRAKVAVFVELHQRRQELQAQAVRARAELAALRSPLYGCSDVELLEWRRAGGAFSILSEAPEGMDDHGVARAMAHLASVARSIGSAPPAETGRAARRG